MDREIRDPIHGFIERSPTEEKIIDSNAFQRLRNIKQLALAYLVYPGATHTRFEHSVGVMHVASKLAEKMLMKGILTEEQKKIVRLTALLHDIGHGPFSHVSENILQKYYDPSLTIPINKEKIHEGITCKIIEYDNALAHFISNDERKEIVKLIKGEKDVNLIMKGIVSGPLDADKQDYLIRDSYYCGVKYGVFDIDRLVHNINYFEEDYNGYKEKVLAVPYEGVYTLEQFLIAKYHMSTQVYRHKIRLITDCMITRGIELGIEQDNLQWLRDLYTYKDEPDYIKNYLTWNDGRLINNILFNNKSSSYSYKIFDRLTRRDLFKCVFSRDLKSFDDAEVIDKLSDINNNIDLTKILENEIAKYLTENFPKPIDKHKVILYQFSIKSIKRAYRDNEGTILITIHDRKSTFEQESALFNSINEKIQQRFLEIYAPVTFENENEKLRKKALFDRDLTSLIESTIKTYIQNKQKNEH